MPNILFARNVLFGKYIFAGLSKRSFEVQYPFIENHFEIDFYDKQGLRTHRLSNDGTNSPLISAEFEYTNNGCGKFSMTLSKDHKIPIAYEQRIDISLFGDNKAWYSGYVQTRPVEGSTETEWEYSGYGFFNQLDGVLVNKTYTNTEISAIVRDIILTYLDGKTNIVAGTDIYSTGYTAEGIKFDYVTAKDVIKQLSEFAVNYIYGVDENRMLFFKPVETDINEDSRFWVGYHITSFLPEEDIDSVENHLFVMDKDSNVVYETLSQESIDAYGLKQVTKKLPNTDSAVDAKQWGDAQLESLKTPKRTAKVTLVNTKDIIGRKIKAEGKALITSEDGSSSVVYPIKTVKYKMSDDGITMSMELGEYTKNISEYILKLTRDIKNIELAQKAKDQTVTTP